jgi:hypothetical protein
LACVGVDKQNPTAIRFSLFLPFFR